MTGRRELIDSFADLLLTRAGRVEPASLRRLRIAQIDHVAKLLRLSSEQAEDRAEVMGVRDIVECCRDEQFASLDADDGLLLLDIDWREVVLRASLRLDHGRRSDRRRCVACGAKAVEETSWGPSSRPPGRHFRRIGDSDHYSARRCRSCGLVQPRR